MTLIQKKCVPCHGGVPPLATAEISALAREVMGWQVVENKKLFKTIKLENFAQSLSLANRIGEVAERENHHPDLLVRWGELRIEIWTHAAGGLTENDFILAAKLDEMLAQDRSR